MPFRRIEVSGHPVFNKVYDGLSNESDLKIRISEIIAEMKKDVNRGNYIKRKPYPDRYRRLGVRNLFVFDIGSTRRLIYAIRTAKDTKTYQYLDLLTHKEYDIIFGYSTS